MKWIFFSVIAFVSLYLGNYYLEPKHATYNPSLVERMNIARKSYSRFLENNRYLASDKKNEINRACIELKSHIGFIKGAVNNYTGHGYDGYGYGGYGYNGHGYGGYGYSGYGYGGHGYGGYGYDGHGYGGYGYDGYGYGGYGYGGHGYGGYGYGGYGYDGHGYGGYGYDGHQQLDCINCEHPYTLMDFSSVSAFSDVIIAEMLSINDTYSCDLNVKINDLKIYLNENL